MGYAYIPQSCAELINAFNREFFNYLDSQEQYSVPKGDIELEEDCKGQIRQQKKLEITVSKLVDVYYRTASDAEARLLQRGQFCWRPGLYLLTRLATLELVHCEPRDERRNRYAVLPNPPANLVFNHTPVHELQLEHDEELLVIKAKRRLFVVASQSPLPWAPPSPTGFESEAMYAYRYIPFMLKIYRSLGLA